MSGFNRTTFGKIGRCVEEFGDPSTTVYEVMYIEDKNDSTMIPQIKTIDRVSEHVAWGGYLTYLAEIEKTSTCPFPVHLPFHVKWIVPDRRFYDTEGRLTMETHGFRLQMTAEDSSIPGAGLGLILRVFDMSGKDRTHFTLSEGELLCLGPYGPFRLEDRKSEAVFDVKSFIHEYEPESYCFESRYDEKEIYIDITNDSDGNLHDFAKANLMCRINEISDGESPSVCADKDPSGSIHYYLGHNCDWYGNLELPVGVSYELKV
jgi:hypothetical protein